MARTLPMVASDWALFLDVDGTLVDYVADPSALRIPRALGETLAELSTALTGALAIISGRSIADLDRLFSPLQFPVAGQHGAELRRDGAIKVLAPPPAALASILAPVLAFAERHPAIRIEHKGLSVAVHYRRTEESRDALHAILTESLAREGNDYELLQSHLAFDIRPRGAHKGFAVEWFMKDAPFAGRVPIFIGDDRTDEDGFAAVLARGGHAIKVGGGASVAPWHLPAPEALWRWLERSKAALTGEPRP
ncbi:MAG TPA: trehalose-phosphatase [Stellaceae bacterium]|nr:trehalose-phosphatase [Stellaceae bacterium]